MTMLRIGICGDEIKIEDCIEEILKLKKEEYQVHKFSTKQELLETKDKPDILFLSVEKRKFDKILKKASETKEEEEHTTLLVKTGTSYHSIPVEKIVYAENNGRKIILHTEEGILEFYGKMNDLEEELGGEFFRCHRGYLVSLSYVSGYDSGNVYLKNGESIYLAKRKITEFAKVYREYLKGNTS
ncbi:MAG: LytTR family transcriptional regulator DNA-binding domain-containing protein [Lachnospiraceae bacterium]|nr:LytTR family transcriptional regulator DNA-binding domain-containing protein [Lachnospiraceae bacterium]